MHRSGVAGLGDGEGLAEFPGLVLRDGLGLGGGVLLGLALLGLGLGGGVLGGGVLLRLAPGESALAAVPLLGNGLTRLSVVAEMAAQLATEAAV